jgi:hypothetical protein
LPLFAIAILCKKTVEVAPANNVGAARSVKNIFSVPVAIMLEGKE